MELLSRHDLDVKYSYSRIMPVKVKEKHRLMQKIRKDFDVLMPYIKKCIETGQGFAVSSVYREFGFDNKFDNPFTIIQYLRNILYFDDIRVKQQLYGTEDHLFFSQGRKGDKCTKMLQNWLGKYDLDDWYIKTGTTGQTPAKHTLSKHGVRGGQQTFLLKSDGVVTFDERTMDEGQAIEFAQYLSSGGGQMRMPLVVRNTPINIDLREGFEPGWRLKNVNFKEIGLEFRITVSDGPNRLLVGRAHGENIFTDADEESYGFVLMSIFGKEWPVTESDIDNLLLRGDISSILAASTIAEQIERIPDTIKLVKKVIAGFGVNKMKGAVTIDENKRILIVTNRLGIFHISLLDGTLFKINMLANKPRYICVDPRDTNPGSVIDGSVNKEINMFVSRIMGKLLMLLNDQYPDDVTRRQVEST